MKETVESRLAEEMARMAELMARWAKWKDNYAPIIDFIENGIGDCRMTYSSLDITLTGSYGMFLGVVERLEELGYSLNKDLPDTTQTYFSSFMRREDDAAPVYISWSNAYCERVQVGTEMVEQPIYEVRCTDVP